MSCPDPKNWDLLTMQVLEEADVVVLHEHLQQCDDCRSRFIRCRREHTALLRMHETFDAQHDKLRKQLMAALPENYPRSEPRSLVRTGLVRFGDLLMSFNTPNGRRAAVVLAPAACIVLFVALFWSTGTSGVFAGAIQHFSEAETIVCRVTIKMTTKLRQPDGALVQTQEFNRTEKLYISGYDGVRRDSYEDGQLVSTTFDSPNSGVIVVDYRNQRYTDFGAVEQSEKAKQLEDMLRDLASERVLPELHFFGLSHDPDRLIQGLRKLTAQADRELGNAVIDGYEAVGFELSGDKIGFASPVAKVAKENRAELWVDTEEGLPLKLVMYFATQVEKMKSLPMSATFRMTATYDRFEFDVPLEPDWFEPQIPEGFKPTDQIDAPPVEVPTEQEFIKALEAFARHAGRYPSSLQPTNMVFEISYLIGSLQAKHLIAKRKGESVDDLPTIKDVGAALQALILFSVLEAGGQQPEYFGETVEPGDTENVLMRWTLEDGRIRVIHGDLEAATLP